VFVRVEVGEGQAVVDLPVAVVVDAVADLGLAGVHFGLVVVTVAAGGHRAGGRRSAALTDDAAVGGRAEAVVVLVRVVGVNREAFVDLPVAVVVDAVADFDRAGVNGGVFVVAVDHAL